ncbi:beta-glucoside-specific PTS transporter subunit IIABC [Bacillus sp. B1-b2]|uniref:beta-glucoside-specific PTS transporter subunit IIABC n=1 Tax=Bacillus sp. B1-b2 TaxID=2653201 RepID=UPI001261686F|nr:beta-glucoside-specific PTS transporter subunit IIABC [Bacillus sp. B1-b2]KAB7668400.1 PTS beta-glucoside transporter subunit IIABC [Bacillus sp. B1-b2]
MKYEQLAKDIIENVGGKENVNSVVHCITRLRFKLKDEGKANTEVLKEMDDIITVMKSSGQYQVVIGNHVPDVYKDVVAIGGFENKTQVATDEDTQGDKQGLFNKFIDMISGIFAPTLGVLAATGMIKGFNALFVALGWYANTTGTYYILNAVGDSLFYFFPVFLGYTAMKKFGGNHFIGMAIGASLVYPSLAGLTAGEPLYTLFAGTLFESPIHITFLGIPVILMSYSSSVIPIILATFVGSKIEKWLAKVIPDVVKNFLVPFLTLLVIVPLTFIVIGPIATWVGKLLGEGTLWIYDLSPILTGLVVGGLWQVFVMFGLHWGLVPIAINNISVHGSDYILAFNSATSLATAGVVLGILVATKQKQYKTLSIPAFISAVFGVSEPALYGMTLPLKRPFIITLITSAIGGVIMGIMGTKAYMMGGLGIFGLPTKISPDGGLDMGFWGAVIAMASNLVVGFTLTYFFGIDRKKEKEELEKQAQKAAAKEDTTENKTITISNEDIASPLKGEVKKLSGIEDAAFSSGLLGKGVAIVPTEGKLVSPVNGTVSAIFPTKHAIGITTDTGAEVLMHIGMDTVQLEGKYYSTSIQQGDRVEKGQLLIEFDIEAIKAAGYPIVTPVVVTNHDQYKEIIVADEQAVDFGGKIITVTV